MHWSRDHMCFQVPAENDDDVDIKSSVAPLSVHSATPVAAPHTAASHAERVQSSVSKFTFQSTSQMIE